DPALARLGQTEDHGEAGDFHPALHIADERLARGHDLRERVLREIAFDAELAQPPSEDFSFRLRLHRDTLSTIMNKAASDRIRRIFVSHQLHFAQITAADLLGMSFAKLRREIADGAILTTS